VRSVELSTDPITGYMLSGALSADIREMDTSPLVDFCRRQRQWLQRSVVISESDEKGETSDDRRSLDASID
jgi:hypothetical protein